MNNFKFIRNTIIIVIVKIFRLLKKWIKSIKITFHLYYKQKQTI